MINDTLKLWIAQSESWHSFMNFKLPFENQADYTFLKRRDDFYISLFSQTLKKFNKEDFSDDDKLELFALAKGLEIYSLQETSSHFAGINLAKNMLYVSSLYYLADFTASAFILAKLFSIEEYQNEIDVFISSFLRREFTEGNEYITYIKRYMQEGNKNILLELKDLFLEKEESFLVNEPDLFISYKIGLALLSNFIRNNIWQDLKDNTDSLINLESFIKNGLTKNPPIWSFFPSQRKALTKDILKSEKAFSLQMPTSAGKTAICELLIYDHIQKNEGAKVLFLAPFRALASELKNGFSKRMAELNISSKSIYGGSIPTEDEKNAIKNVDVLISTPEKFIAIESILPDVYNLFSLIICDEGHLIDDNNRGLSYELLLSKFKSPDINNHKRFIFLSAIIPNIEEINEWLDGDNNTLITSEYRPTHLEYAFLKPMSNKNFLLDVNPLEKRPYNYQLYNFLTKSDFKFLNNKTNNINTYSHNSKKSRSVATSLKSMITGTVALFSPQKKGNSGVQGLAEETIKQITTLALPNPLDYSNIATVLKLEQYFNRIFGTDYLLSKLAGYGVVFHHGDLPQDVREVIEKALRNNDIRFVICTNTLAEGVNLPIKVIIIHSTKRFNPKRKEWEDLLYRDLKNLVGRAGRAGKETKGLVIVVDSTDQKLMRNVILNKKSEAANGYLYYIIEEITKMIKNRRLIIDNTFLEQRSEEFLILLDSIDTALVNLLSEEIEVDELNTQIGLLISKTFAYFQASDAEKETLENLFLQRGKKIRKYIESKEFVIIKRSNSDLRLYENTVELLDLDNDIWINTDNPCEEKWVCHILDVLLSLPQVQYKINEFNTSKTVILDNDFLKEIILLWMRGKWYGEIAKEMNLDIEIVLNIFSSVINSNIQMYASKVIRIADNLLEENKKEISKVILDWSNYVNYGLSHQTELDLTEIGFTDRDAIIRLNVWIQKNSKNYQSLRVLKRLIKKDKNIIVEQLKPSLTAISLERLLENMKVLNYKQIL